jgi:membrane-associated protease RseP (regulator of RpoE activity)
VETAVAVAIGFLAFLLSFTLVTTLVGALFRIPIARVQFGYDPSISLFRVGATDVRVSPILLGSHVKYAAPDPDKPFAPWWIRCVVALAGPLVSLALCALFLGERVFDEVLMAWPQMWAAATDFSTPFDPAAALDPWIAADDYPAAAAIVAVKVAMFNLLPLPFLNGGTFLIALWEGVTGRYRPELPQLPLMLSLAVAVAFVLILASRLVAGF